MLPLPKGAVWQAFLVLCLVLLVKEAQAEVRVVCYYTNWSVYRPGTAKYNPQNINPYLCTHLIYAFGGFTKDNTMKPFDKYQDIEQGGYAKFTGLKSYNKQLKTMIAIGGWNEASSRFSPLVANPERRQLFIRNILKFLRQNHFDGLDLDWEYPAFRDGGKPRDRDNYAKFVEELRSEFDRESSKTGRPRLLLTMAVPAGIEYIEKGYDIPKLNDNLDWFNILSYDYHSAFEPSANHHAPLYSLEEPSEYNYDTELNIDYTVKFYIEAGADRNKLVLGIPTYGRSYTLVNEDDTAIGAPSDGPGEQGDATREKGYLAYYEICQGLKDDPDWTVVQPNENAMGPYAYRGNQWVGYDDEAIVRKKAEYVAENGLGGIMFWSLDNDDFRGTCSGKPYPLIEAAKEALLDAIGSGLNEVSAPSKPKKTSRPRSRAGSSTTRNRVTEETKVSRESTTSTKQTSSSRKKSGKRRTSTAPPRTTTASTTSAGSLYIGGRTTTPAPPTTPDPGADFKCEEEGFFAHPRDCKKYFWCLDSGPSNLGIVAHQFTCPSGLYFNTAADSCDFTRNVQCKKPSKETTTTTTARTTASTTTTTTTRPPSRITAATSAYSYIQRTSTTAAPDDDDEEYEDDEEETVEGGGHEEDPKVIKELIDLIKRVGGLDELEKQLLLQEDGSVVMKNPKNDQISTTPSSISQSLYAKVLSRPNPLSSLRNRLGGSKFTSKKEEVSTTVTDESSSSKTTKYTSTNRNSRPGPQNDGIDKLAEFEGFLREKPQYVTIKRTRPTKSTDGQLAGDDEEVDDLEGEEKGEEEAVAREEATSESSQRRSTSAYVNIRRTRPTKSADAVADEVESEDAEEVTGSKTKYQTINRVRGTASSTNNDDDSDTEEGSDKIKSSRPQSTYQTLTRTKSSATAETNSQAETEDQGAEVKVQTKVQYQSFTRTRNATATAQDETGDTENEESSSQKSNVRPTYQSFTRIRGSTLSPESDPEEKDVEQQAPKKQTYQSLNRFRPSTSPSPADDDDEEEKSQTKARTRPTLSPRGTTTTTATPEDAEDAQKKNRYSFLSRRQSTVSVDDSSNDVTPTEASISRRRGTTTVASSSVVGEDAVLKSLGSTNRYQVYDRTRPTLAVDTAQSLALTLNEDDVNAKLPEDDPIPSVTIRSQAKGNGRRPVLNVRRRITPNQASNLTSAEDTTAGVPPRIIVVVDSNNSPSTSASVDSAGVTISSSTVSATGFTNRFNLNRSRPTASATTTSAPPDPPASVTPKVVVIRRKFARPVSVRKSTTTTPPPQQIGASTGTTDGEDVSATPNNDGRTTISRRPQKTTTQFTTLAPLTTQPVVRRRPSKPQAFEKVNTRQFAGRTYRPVIDYDYYDDEDVRFVNKTNSQVKVVLHGRGIIECLDQGNFPHPLSCKKFISCAKMEIGGVVGWEYTCPKGLSYDPVGGICNWSAGLGCKD